jgi:archaetidylinositol phosphate synthase
MSPFSADLRTTSQEPTMPSTASPSLPSTFRQETRIQNSVLTRLERRALSWLAHRLPARVNSDHLTVLALAAMVGVGASYWLSSLTPAGLLLASALLVVNWFGDSLDGTIARVRNRQRPRYGYYVDHVVDVVGICFLFGGLVLGGLMHPTVALVTLLAYFLVSLEVYLATHSLGEFRMSFAGMGPTELRLVLVAANTALLLRPTTSVGGTWLTPFDVGGLIASAALVVVFVVSAIRNTATLYRAGQ